MRVSDFDEIDRFETEGLLTGSKERNWLWFGLIVSLAIHFALCTYFYRTRFASADAVFAQKGITLLPDIYANAGGVTVSYFEWVQGLQSFFWDEQDVNAKLERIMVSSFEQVASLAEQRHVSMRLAAYLLAVRRVADANMTRGIYP